MDHDNRTATVLCFKQKPQEIMKPSITPRQKLKQLKGQRYLKLEIIPYSVIITKIIPENISKM